MNITLVPIRSDDTMIASVSGDVLTINGDTANLSGIAEGDVLPSTSVDSKWVGGKEITRVGGILQITLLYPVSKLTGMSETIVNVTSGTVPLPEEA